MKFSWVLALVLGAGCGATVAPTTITPGVPRHTDLTHGATSALAWGEGVELVDTTPTPGGATPSEGQATDEHRTEVGGDTLERAIGEVLADLGEDRDLVVPRSFRGEVQSALQALTRPGPKRRWFERSLVRMDQHYADVDAVFSERHLPKSLYYLALVESGFNPTARSHAGAVGLWQFIRGTGRRYGLRIDRELDERTDPHRSTLAAREYLLDLILEFGAGHSMLLAMAAYNAGEGRVRGRLRRLDDYRERSFWTLSERGLLPGETRRYVPMIIAAAIAGERRAQYNLPARRVYPRRPAAPVAPKAKATVARRRPVPLRYLVQPGNSLSTIAGAFGVSVAALRRTNRLRGNQIFVGAWLRIPTRGWKRVVHRVRRGDTLGAIAARHRTTVRALQTFNGKANSTIRIGERIVVYRRAG